MTTDANIRVAGAEEARALVQALAALLVNCVDGGASVSFRAPLDMQKAAQFWMKVADGIASGDRILLVAEVSGRIVGTVQIVVGQPENQPHRADVAKLLVHGDFRRHGIGGRLMAEVDAVAARAGRTLLVLDTETGSDGERLYTRAGWTRAGVIPGYALKPHGGLTSTTYFYKQLSAAGSRRTKQLA